MNYRSTVAIFLCHTMFPRYCTNVPLEETIQILADKAFTDNWFNKTHQLNLSRMDLVDLLRASTKDQLFQFNGQLYEQTNGVAMGSPLGPLVAKVFMGSIEETLELAGKMPPFCKRYVDDTLTIMPDTKSAANFSRFLTTATHLLSSTWKQRLMVCYPFLECSSLTELPKLRPRSK